MSSLKNTFKYILFTFVFMFLFMPSVKAKYMVCNYTANNANHNIRLYYENSSGKFKLYYVAAYSNYDSKWDKYNSKLKVDSVGRMTLKNTSGSDSAIRIYEASEEDFNNNIINVNSNKCPKINISSNAKNDTNLNGEQEIFELDNLPCKYDSDKTYTLSSWFVGVENLSKSNPKFDNTYSFQRFVLPSGDEVDEYGYPVGLDKNHNYSDQTYMYYYLKNASKYGCPRSVLYGGYTGHWYGGYESQINNIFYLTYKWNLDANDKIVIDPSGENDGYTITKLICNTDYLTNFQNELDSKTNFWNTDYEYYAELDEEGWKKAKNNSSICANSKKMSDFKYCYINNKMDSIKKDAENFFKGSTVIKLKKVGCDKELKDTDNFTAEIIGKYNELIKKMRDNGELTDEQADKLLEKGENTVESIDGVIDSLFKSDDSELKKLAGNKNKSVDCDAIFGNPCDKDSLSLMCFITVIFNVIRYLIPGILILLGSIDFAKVVISNEKEAMSKSLSIFIQRIIIAIAIFFLPLLINFFLQIFDSGYSMSDKINCVIERLSGDSND